MIFFGIIIMITIVRQKKLITKILENFNKFHKKIGILYEEQIHLIISQYVKYNKIQQ